MNHEFWNEIGNLYFMNGAYEPAIHAYLRSIKLENTFGRPYSNLALAYVQIGKYTEAIKLYRRGIELLSDKREKAATWNRIGILYRQLKDYSNALEAYQRADLIMPQQDDYEQPPENRAEAKVPLTVSMPEIDLDAILAKGNPANLRTPVNLILEINAEFQAAEAHTEDLEFEGAMMPPEFENYSQLESAIIAPPTVTQSEWKLAYVEEAHLTIPSATPAEPETKAEEELDIIIPIDLQSEPKVIDDDTQSDVLPIPPVESPETCDISPADIAAEANDPFAENAAFDENVSYSEVPQTAAIETASEATQYSQTKYPLTDLSPEDRQALNLEIIKYQQATSNNPRSYILWESLGEAYKSAGQYKDAIHAFQKAISLNPANSMCHYRLGLVYAAEKRGEEAIRSFKKVLELDPSLPQAHASLASQYRKMGLEEVAQKHIEKARAMQVDGESDYNHACLEAICGNNERALELLEVALQSKQTYVTWAQNDPDFHSLHNDYRFQELLSTYAINV
ncbi:MAG: tetratricopeptide repeat protein [Chloroflexi bacterium]|nr:tetratricopeptide repeat protein [Chloroflexota bacterium]